MRHGPSRRQALVKRAFDLVVAVVGLVLTGWVILLAAVAARLDTGASGIFRQVRVGRDGELFEVLKIRTMRKVSGSTVTRGDDPRITRLGAFFRRMKIDELPQLINVLRGEMSVVGPRPDVPGFADELEGDDRMILSVRPGITGPASLRFRNEEALLAGREDAERFNREVLYPEKVRINRRYVAEYSFRTDLRYLWATVAPGGELDDSMVNSEAMPQTPGEGAGHERIYLSPPHMSGTEEELVRDAFRSNWIAPLGPHVDAFEREFSAAVGSPHAAALSSGTAALHLALMLVGVEAGDEVLVSTLTFAASVNPIRYLGARPVFIDAEPASWNMDPALLEEALRDRAHRDALPAAVVVVHLYGQAADLERITDLCEEYGVPLVEDAAEALGATYRGRAPGTFGRVGIFSFNGNKIITTSGGGMLVSTDGALVERARKLATQAREDAPHYEHREVGYNYRLSNVLAAIGRGQLAVLEDRVAARRRNFAYYERALGDLPGFELMPEAPWGQHSRWLTTLTIDPERAGATRDDVRLALGANNIEARPVWKPMHRQPAFREFEAYGGAVADQLFAYGLCLPSGSRLTEPDLERIAGVVRDAVAGREGA